MALGRTYYTEINKDETNTLTTALTAKATIWMWSSFLVGLITGTAGRTGAIPVGARWTVVGSSDGVTAGLDANARGLVAATFDATKWVRATAGSAHSWLLLSKAFGGTTYYLLIDMSTASDNFITWTITKTLPTGGTTTNAPTVVSAASWVNQQFMPNAAAASGVRGFLSVDASGHFWFGSKAIGTQSGKIATQVFGFWDLEGTHASDTDPWAMVAAHSTTGVLSEVVTSVTGGASASQMSFRGRVKGNSAEATMMANVMGGVSSVFALLGASQDVIRTEDPAQSVELWVETAGFAGRRGVLPDVLIGAKKADGTAQPNGAAIERCLLGAFYFPMMAVPSTS